jgi:chromosome segregation ATPase
MKRNIQALILGATLISSTAPVVLFAQAGAAASQACQRTTQKVDERVKTYEEKAKVHDARFVKMIETLTNISARLKTRSVDTSALDAQIADLTAKREKINQDKTAFMQKMTDAKAAACGTTPNEVKTKINEARTLQQSVVASIKEFQNSAKTVRATVASIRAQLVPAATNATSSSAR